MDESVFVQICSTTHTLQVQLQSRFKRALAAGCWEAPCSPSLSRLRRQARPRARRQAQTLRRAAGGESSVTLSHVYAFFKCCTDVQLHTGRNTKYRMERGRGAGE